MLRVQKPEGVVNEALQQIAYADRIVLNKIDLVSPEELESLELRLRAINSLAQVGLRAQPTASHVGVTQMTYFTTDRGSRDIEAIPCVWKLGEASNLTTSPITASYVGRKSSP